MSKTTFQPSVLVFSALLALAATSCSKSDAPAPAAAAAEAPAAPAAPVSLSAERAELLRQFLVQTSGEQNVTWSAATGAFMIDGDVAMPLDEVEAHYAQKDAPQQGTARTEGVQHRKSYYLVTPVKAATVKIYADGTVPAVWKAALDRAIANWNATGSKLYITRITTPTGANTTVTAANTGGTGTIAVANYPDYLSNPGRKITINTYYNYLAAGLQTFAMTHELGHTYGFGHTNSTYGTLVPGSPNSDSYSVMNSVCKTWSSFSTYDLLAIRTVYPK
ncbi:M57 family metalloprotease [Flaviaesturariibacter amylovorans]|uniref:Dual-action HEIGH metallo-peptidase n=1 Tax=Flaviaesturariibacter amylovorans TaxID=1084520 RepID=A0ABP8HIR4_9BACT